MGSFAEIVGGRVAVSAKPHFADAADGGERRSQLVRNIRREAAHLIERRLQPELRQEHLDLSCLRRALNGSEPIHARTVRAFQERFAAVFSLS